MFLDLLGLTQALVQLVDFLGKTLEYLGILNHLLIGRVRNLLFGAPGLKFAGALIIPSFTELKAWCNENKIPYTTNEEMIKNPEVLKLYANEVNELNKGLGETEKIKKQVLLADEWSIANGLLTPTLKAKRKIITAKYKDVIEKMFA